MYVLIIDRVTEDIANLVTFVSKLDFERNSYSVTLDPVSKWRNSCVDTLIVEQGKIKQGNRKEISHWNIRELF
jgi:hypothetical protein